MCGIKKWEWRLLLVLFGIFFQTADGFAYQINDQLSIGGVIAGIYQYQRIEDAPGFHSEGRAALTCEPEISFTPTESDQLFAKVGIGAGNGLMGNGRSPFVLAPYGGNVQDSYMDINGRRRDYLLTAWYRHTFTFTESHTLALTVGIIDATDYMDENAFANDEFTQFMNQALINGPNAFLPSYDMGLAIEWGIGGFSVKGVGMALGSTDAAGLPSGGTGEDNQSETPYNFYGMQFGYRVNSKLGEGNFRFIGAATSRDFINVPGTQKERKIMALFSFDQQLGQILGAWLRFGWQDDDAAIVYNDIYSGGLNISGRLWHREGDNVGIGYAYVGGGNQGLNYTDVFEVYGRIAVTSIFAVTGDVQYMKDAMAKGESPEGWIFGLRVTAEF
ncbi:MAG: carbohydrate porin [Deltaproteobacteria bacterium]|nr:carbohydrate porin [Deltaproteobacteria bacterium]